jgi:hypothetical protein
MIPRSSKRDLAWFALVAALLALACIGVYAAALRGPFLMDDFDAIHPLATMQSAGAGWWDVLQGAPSHIRARWVSNFSFLLSHAAGGAALPPSPFAFKLGNLLVHLGCGATCFLLARALLARWDEDARRARWIALLAAGLFLLHPLLLSTVLYPVQRMAQLATLFCLLAVWAYLRWRTRIAQASTRGHLAGIALVLGLIALAVLSKENGALAPLLIGVVELVAFRWPRGDDPQRVRFEQGFGLACAAPLVLGTVLLALRWPALMAGYATRDFGPWQRALTELHVLLDYLAQIVWPRIAGMGLYRDDVALTSSLDLVTVVIALLFAGTIALAILARRRQPALALGMLWFFAAHAMESTVLPLELVFEHRNYLALFGPALALAVLVARLPSRIAIAASLLALSALALQTARRAQDWTDYDTWIARENANHPGSMRAGTDLIAFLATRADLAPAHAALAALQSRFPQHAQPVVLELALRCARPAPASDAFPSDDTLRRLREGTLGKDAFHAFDALRARKLAGQCSHVDWSGFARVAGAVAANPELRRHRRAGAAWHRLHAGALAHQGDWRATADALGRALALEDNDPRDWLLLMRAQLELGDGAGYARARARLLALLGPNLGPFATELQQLDAAAGRGRDGS